MTSKETKFEFMKYCKIWSGIGGKTCAKCPLYNGKTSQCVDTPKNIEILKNAYDEYIIKKYFKGKDE